MRATHLCCPSAAVVGLAACAVLIGSAVRLSAAPPAPPAKILFVVDGAGGFEACSRMFRQAIADEKLPLEVRTFHWSHGFLRVLSDQMHSAHVKREGQSLAATVLRCRREAPGVPIVLVGHSAGSGVVLTAADYLPPNTLDRIVLLAPAVSARCDLRNALRCACHGIDAFTSNHDWICLGLGTSLAGTTDRYWLTGAAGKTGFQPILHEPGDEMLYAKLRQYPWEPSLTWTGNKGGHYGAYQPSFLRTFVLPLIMSCSP